MQWFSATKPDYWSAEQELWALELPLSNKNFLWPREAAMHLEIYETSIRSERHFYYFKYSSPQKLLSSIKSASLLYSHVMQRNMHCICMYKHAVKYIKSKKGGTVTGPLLVLMARRHYQLKHPNCAASSCIRTTPATRWKPLCLLLSG